MTTYTVCVDFCVAAIRLDGRISICVFSDELDCRVQATRADCSHFVCHVMNITAAGMDQRTGSMTQNNVAYVLGSTRASLW